MPPSLRHRLRSHPLRQQVVAALIGAIGTVAAASMTALITTDWFPERLGFRSGEIHVTRAILYGRILYFRDRAKGQARFQRKLIGLPTSKFAGVIDLFDEGLYVRAFYLHRHKVENMLLEGHSSGTVDATPIIPSIAQFDIDAYDKSEGKMLRYTLDIKKTDYVVVATHYYNGYQRNPRTGRYESDGGMHIDFRTDEAIMIFDFTGLDYKSLLRPEPKIWLEMEKKERQPISAAYVNGVIVSSAISKPPVGSRIVCDWEWSTE